MSMAKHHYSENAACKMLFRLGGSQVCRYQRNYNVLDIGSKEEARIGKEKQHDKKREQNDEQ